MPPPRKVSSKQLDLLADFAKTHQHITMGRFGSVENLKEARKAWESVAVRLNTVGIKKTPTQWRRYWIEYKAKLKSKAADSRRGTIGVGGSFRQLSDREHQLLEIINHVAAEGLQEPNVSDIRNSPNTSTSSPESPQPLLEVEWLDYESESDDQLAEETDRAQSVEPKDDSEAVEKLQSAVKEDNAEPVRKRWETLRGYRNVTERVIAHKNLQPTGSQSNRLSRNQRMKESYQDRRRKCKNGSRSSETPLQNNVSFTSSSPQAATDHQYFDKGPKKTYLSDVTATALQYFNSKKNKTHETQDPDLLFFFSILPEMKQMTPDQKRQFKSGIWSLANQILEQNTVESFSDHNYGLSQR